MTGEVTLTGLVLPIGGLKEKVLAARRAGIKRVIVPRGNQKDLRDLPEDVRKEMEFIFADRVRDVLNDMFPGVVPAESGKVVPDSPSKVAEPPAKAA
jgi:ATP-dependent Lon protease